MVPFWRRSLYVLAVLFVAPAMLSQSAAPTPAEFKASIATVRASSPEWFKLIESVNVDDLPVEYATGKQYEESKYIIREDLKMVLLWGDRAAKSESLFEEVNYLSAVQELQAQLQLFSGLVIDFSAPDKKTTAKVQNWATAMSDLANGSVQTAFKTAFTYTTRHALSVEKACAKS